MKPTSRGQRPRPRVALVGEFGEQDIERYRRVFATIWQAPVFDELVTQVDAREIDLVVIAPRTGAVSEEWLDQAHVICFSQVIPSLPGPLPGCWVRRTERTQTEQYVLPELSSPLTRRREADTDGLKSVKGWWQLRASCYQSPTPSIGGIFDPENTRSAEKILRDSAVIRDFHTGSSLAVIYERAGTRLGVAWLPNPIFPQVAWVELITAQWAKSDEARFPDFDDWTGSPEWMLPEEEELFNRINALENQRAQAVVKINALIAHLETTLRERTLAGNRGRRRLLTGQGDELVIEVASVFRELGFIVESVDGALPPGAAKREDLRLRRPAYEGSEWEAIVAVRGYEASGGMTADLQRLGRFADLYVQEKGHLPAKRIYVVNGQLELPPSQRQEPLVAADDDLRVFAESDGLVISTIALFRVAKGLGPLYTGPYRASIVQATGRWSPSLSLQNEDEQF